MSRSYEELTTEIRTWCVEKGWRGPEAPVRELMDDVALMHSEVAEALEAYRDHNLARWIVSEDYGVVHYVYGPDEYDTLKPEGFPAEIADTFIRLLDNAAEQGIVIDVLDSTSKVSEIFFQYRGKSVPFHLGMLHDVIAAMSTTILKADPLLGREALKRYLQPRFNDIAIALEWIAEHYDFDLIAETEAKMKYNWTRAFRHGGKLT